MCISTAGCRWHLVSTQISRVAFTLGGLWHSSPLISFVFTRTLVCLSSELVCFHQHLGVLDGKYAALLLFGLEQITSHKHIKACKHTVNIWIICQLGTQKTLGDTYRDFV
jgi:hypothetical protein